MEIYGTIFTKKGVFGDFEWQINSGNYEDALFIFNDDEYRNKWKKGGKGNSVIRKYNKYACSKPRSVGITTGYGTSGYTSLNEKTKQKIDSCIEEIKEIINQFGYTKIYYSAKESNGILGTSIFHVNQEVLEYITKEIHSLINNKQ